MHRSVLFLHQTKTFENGLIGRARQSIEELYCEDKTKILKRKKNATITTNKRVSWKRMKENDNLKRTRKETICLHFGWETGKGAADGKQYRLQW